MVTRTFTLPVRKADLAKWLIQATEGMAEPPVQFQWCPSFGCDDQTFPHPAEKDDRHWNNDPYFVSPLRFKVDGRRWHADTRKIDPVSDCVLFQLTGSGHTTLTVTFADWLGEKGTSEYIEHLAKQLDTFGKGLRKHFVAAGMGSGETTQRTAGPWEVIPRARDRGWVEKWWKGETETEIARGSEAPKKTVHNTIGRLRDKWGHNVVPTREELEQMQKLG